MEKTKIQKTKQINRYNMKAIKFFVAIFICALMSMCTTSCCSSCNEDNQNDSISYIVADSTVNAEVIGKFGWSKASGWGGGQVKVVKVLIGNHEYLMTDHSSAYTIGICHYEDCKYCKEHIVKAELVK